ncbi:MAG: hypothetical protein ACTSSJ_03105 [Candidatus Odinarchaeia archaeon]
MKHMKNLAIVGGLLALLLLLPLPTLTNAQPSNDVHYAYSSGQVTITTDKLAVKVTGISGEGDSIVHFLFWNVNDNSTVYHVKFVQLIEFIDSNGDNAFQYDEHVPTRVLALQSLKWNFSGFVNDSAGIHFNFTLDTPSANNPYFDVSGLTVILSCHLYYDNVSVDGISIAGLAELKINVVIAGWPWSSNDPNTALALRMDITSSIEEDGGVITPNVKSPKGDEIHMDSPMGEGEEMHLELSQEVKQEITLLNTEDQVISYVGFAKTATTDDGEIDVYVSYRTTGSGLMVFFCYPKWNGTLVHDPSLGVTENLNVLPWYMSPIVLLGIGVAIVSVIGVFIVIKRRQ